MKAWLLVLCVLSVALGACGETPQYRSGAAVDEADPVGMEDGGEEDDPPVEDPDRGGPEEICIEGACECPDGSSVGCGGCFPEDEIPSDLCDCEQICPAVDMPDPTPEPEPEEEICIDCVCACPNGDDFAYGTCIPASEFDPDVDYCRESECEDVCGDVDVPNCDEVECRRDCPLGYLTDEEGCDLCACDAGLLLSLGDDEADLEHVSFSASAGLFIGGINRWTFDLLWRFDDPMASDEAYELSVPMRLMQDVGFEPGEAWETFFINDPGPWEAFSGSVTLEGAEVTTESLTISEGFFSIRRVGETFDVRVWLVLQGDALLPGRVEAAAAFTTPIPDF